jgi:hypothetical protein
MAAERPDADAFLAHLPLRQVNIGDPVLYLERVHVLRGLDPMSVPNRTALLQDAQTGEVIRAPLDEVEPAGNRQGLESEGLG